MTCYDRLSRGFLGGGRLLAAAPKKRKHKQTGFFQPPNYEWSPPDNPVFHVGPFNSAKPGEPLLVYSPGSPTAAYRIQPCGTGDRHRFMAVNF